MKKVQKLKRENANHLKSTEIRLNGYFLSKLFQTNSVQGHTLLNKFL